MITQLVIYGYATGVFSSRGIAKKLEEDVAFRMLTAGNFPAHRTMSEFRRRHLEDFRKLFVEVVGLARELGLAKLGTLSIDGTKVRANASKRKAMAYRRMNREQGCLEAEIGEWLRRADEIDRGGRRPLREGSAAGRDPGRVADPEGSIGGDPGGQGAIGGGPTSSGSGSGTETGTGSEAEERATLQAGLWGTESEGTKQLHGPGERDHAHQSRRVPAVLQRAGDRRRSESGDRLDAGDGKRQ